MRSRYWIVALVTLLTASLACGPATPPPGLPPTAIPTQAPTATPTETEPSPVCPPPGDPPDPVQPTELAGYPPMIRAYLSAGGSPATLRATLETWNILLDADQADLTGDGHDELILVLRDPQQDWVVPPAGLFVFGCRDGGYEMLAQDVPGELSIGLTAVTDVTGDGLQDLIYAEVSCGAHTCFETLHVLGWDGSGLGDRIDGTLELPYATYSFTPGRIEARTGGIGSAGAEPQQLYTEVWEWDGGAFVFTERIWDPPVYRYHALLDGERALLAGDLAAARQAYEQVIAGGGLQEWGAVWGMVDPAEERAQLVAFALWRLALIELIDGDPNQAQGYYDLLQIDHPAGTPGHDVAVIAQTFWTAVQATGSVAGGCAQVVASSAGGSPVIDFFNASYGYANPWWEPQDLCPPGITN